MQTNVKVILAHVFNSIENFIVDLRYIALRYFKMTIFVEYV